MNTERCLIMFAKYPKPEYIVALIKDSKETAFANSKTMTSLMDLGLMEIS